LRFRKKRQTDTPVVRRYADQLEFDTDRVEMGAAGMHVASTGADPRGGIRVVWSPHRRYSIELRELRTEAESVDAV
jgi:hypothetical protein